MCARRFLIAITILTMLAVAAGFAIYQFGGAVLRTQYTPSGHYAAPAKAGSPDYSRADAWIARPDIPNNAGQWLPPGVARERAPGQAAVFFIHPTTYLKGDRWNAPIFEPDSGRRDELFVQSQASAFNNAGEIWAPRYRQAAFGAFLLDNKDAQQALDLAYGDVRAAFDRFLAQLPANRPIILAGHSQGALHLIRLLKERHSALGNRLVAAYVIGWPVDTRADLPALGYPACGAAEQSGCILSWMTFGDPPNPDLILSEWERQKGLSGASRSKHDVLCTDPISGRVGGASPAESNPGTLVPSADFTSATLVAGAVGAHCDDGLLIVGGEIPSLGPFVLPGNNYHVYDYALFWGAVRRDALRRLAAWRR